MDLILFSSAVRPVTAEIFLGWPAHMQQEFALLVREHGYEDRQIRKLCGISGAALDRARNVRPAFSISYRDFDVSEPAAKPASESDREKARVRRHKNALAQRQRRDRKREGDDA